MTRQVPLTCSGHTRPVVDLAFSPITSDGFFIISACKDGKPMLREGQTGDWIGTFEGHKGAVWSARLNLSATLALTGSADFSAKLWDAISGKERHTFAHKHIVRTVDFAKESSKFLTGSMEKKLRIYDIEKPDAEPELLENFATAIKVGMFANHDTMAITAGEDNVVRVWDLRSKQEAHKIELDAPATSVEISSDEQTLTLAHGSTISFYKLSDFTKKGAIVSSSPVSSASLNPSNTKVVSGGLDFHLHVYDYASGNQLEVYKGHHGPVHCVRFSPDGELYASGSEDGTIRLWQTDVGKEYGLWKLNA